MLYNGGNASFHLGTMAPCFWNGYSPFWILNLTSRFATGFYPFLHVHDGHATIVVQLPTSWCAANLPI